jgi:hypothetical protein
MLKRIYADFGVGKLFMGWRWRLRRHPRGGGGGRKGGGERLFERATNGHSAHFPASRITIDACAKRAGMFDSINNKPSLCPEQCAVLQCLLLHNCRYVEEDAAIEAA